MAGRAPVAKVIGVLVPFFNTAVEPELADLRPRGVSNQTARFHLDAGVLENVVTAAGDLMPCRPDVFIIGLATESFPGGLELLRQGAAAVADATGVPVVTASHATRAALEHLAVRRVAVVTPFDEGGNAHVRAAFEEGGFEVLGLHGLACPSLDAIGRTPPDDVRQAFRAADRDGAEAVVQVGTGLPVLPLVQELEETLRKPVVACNAASYWQALRETGIRDAVPGFGRLLANA